MPAVLLDLSLASSFLQDTFLKTLQKNIKGLNYRHHASLLL
ncbi:MAG: hypothetical protein ACTS73_03025 [Arsenophonus sp. NEOnobi-MAG3]